MLLPSALTCLCKNSLYLGRVCVKELSSHANLTQKVDSSLSTPLYHLTRVYSNKLSSFGSSICDLTLPSLGESIMFYSCSCFTLNEVRRGKRGKTEHIVLAPVNCNRGSRGGDATRRAST